MAKTPDDVKRGVAQDGMAREMLAGQVRGMLDTAAEHLTGPAGAKIVERLRELLDLLAASPAAVEDAPRTEQLPQPEWMNQINHEIENMAMDPRPPGVVGAPNVVEIPKKS